MKIEDTIDNGENEVQVATIGTIIGSDIEGNPVEQNFTPESLVKIAEDSEGKEFLVDADHESEKGITTEAKGWISNLEFKKDKGLFGKIKWTDIGRKLIENRVFRWLSPSWLINSETKEPVEMTSVALTNRPSQAGKIEAIINSEPIEQNFTIENKDILNMTKEELKKFIEEILNEIKQEEEKEIVTEEEEEKTEEKTEEIPKEEVKEEVKEEEVKEEEVKEEKTEEVKEEEVKEEVIKIETLNSAPVPEIKKMETWKNLSGNDFINWINSGSYKN